MLPPGFCWGEAGKIEIDPDEHVAGAIRLVFAKFRELGSARQVFLWLRSADIKMPVGGEVVAVNTVLNDAPETVNQDPMSAGWFLRVRPDGKGEPAGLLDKTAYDKLTGK